VVDPAGHTTEAEVSQALYVTSVTVTAETVNPVTGQVVVV